jgi:hypothetical protein
MSRLVFFLLIACALVFANAASAQQTGDVIVFAVPLGSEVGLPTGDDPGDKVLFTGPPSEQLASGGTCFQGTVWAQNVVFVDTRQPGTRGSRRTEIVVFRPEPVAPGTRLTNFAPAGPNCTISGVTYQRFAGIVD